MYTPVSRNWALKRWKIKSQQDKITGFCVHSNLMFHILRISSFLNEIRVISFKQTPTIIRRLHFNSVKRIHCTQKIEKLLSRISSISIRQIFIPKFKFQRARRHRFENKEARMFIIRAKYNTRTARVSQLISRPTLPDRVVLVAREVVETKFQYVDDEASLSQEDWKKE